MHLAFSISCTSRKPREGERDGVNYFFLQPEDFRRKIVNGEFLEYEEVYENHYYGTLKSQVEAQQAKGENIVFDVDVRGSINIKKYYGDRALSVFILPPSVEELRKRLEKRGTDTPEAVEERIGRATYEMSFADRFDRKVVNDDLEKAEQEVFEIVSAFLSDKD